MTLFVFRGVKNHEWAFYDPINMKIPTLLIMNNATFIKDCLNWRFVNLSPSGSSSVSSPQITNNQLANSHYQSISWEINIELCAMSNVL